MFIRADLKCYYCGHVSGQLEGDSTRLHQTAVYLPRPGNPAAKAGEQIRCGRCGGPVYMDDIETIRVRRAKSRFSEDEAEVTPAVR